MGSITKLSIRCHISWLLKLYMKLLRIAAWLGMVSEDEAYYLIDKWCATPGMIRLSTHNVE